ncbi:MAG: GHKL domain-containing protein, partial [Clostridiaceae bacterium]|nr:GHKL domain-containing protein [Clostridiaceae bacterium]
MIGSDIICAGILSFSAEVNLEDTRSYGLYRTLEIVIVKIVQVFVVKLSGIFVKWKKNANNILEIKLILPLLLCQVFSIFLVYDIFMTAYQTNDKLSISDILSILALMYMNLIIFWYFDKINASYEYKRQKEFAEIKLDFQKDYYSLLEEHQRETESLWHDMKKHISSITELYENSFKPESERYIKDLNGKINAVPKILRTDDSIINSLIMDELRKAKKESIDVRLDVNLSNTMKIDPIDLCVILGNTLENAIDACCVLQDEAKRFIDLK